MGTNFTHIIGSSSIVVLCNIGGSLATCLEMLMAQTGRSPTLDNTFLPEANTETDVSKS
jgi:hypothetical protein